MTKRNVLNDLRVFKGRGFYKRFKDIYARLPVTKCDGCGICCSDPPKITYPEFLYIFNYFEENFNSSQKISFYRYAIKECFYDLVMKRSPCVFLDDSNKCLIYPVSPISCKRWGTQSENINNKDWESDLKQGKDYQKHYKKLGIIIPDEVVFNRTPFCNKVKIISNPYKFNIDDYDNIYKEILDIIAFYGDRNNPSYNLPSYLIELINGKPMYSERIEMIKKYQNGDKEAIENYANNISLENVI